MMVKPFLQARHPPRGPQTPRSERREAAPTTALRRETAPQPTSSVSPRRRCGVLTALAPGASRKSKRPWSALTMRRHAVCRRRCVTLERVRPNRGARPPRDFLTLSFLDDKHHRVDVGAGVAGTS